jgi:hypothetical protein
MSVKGLILQASNDSIVATQCEPFADNRKLLRQKLNIEFEHVKCDSLAAASDICKKKTADAIFLLSSWRESSTEAEEIIKSIRDSAPDRKLIFVDPFAQTSTRYFNLLPYVDWFLKRQILKDISKYNQQLIGGSPFTDFLANQQGFELGEWSVESEIPEGYENRITTGWNLGTANRFKKALLKKRFWFSRPVVKDIDIFCRLSLGSQQKQEWYCQYRLAALEALKPLESDYNLVAFAGFSGTSELVPRRQYFDELQRSRIVFSPFGWGETCWRDFEAACYNCLLIKPSMEHIATEPNIFIPGKTYVPVQWDFSDLEEKCRYYLDRPDEANQIIQNARQVYAEYFEQGGFVNKISQVIK